MSKFITESSTKKQIIQMHILLSISRSNDKRTKKYEIRNIFLKKSYTYYDGETSSRPFSEKPKLSIYLDW